MPNPARASGGDAAEFNQGAATLPRYRSRRLALSLPLPDGPAWVIDDHSRAELVAKHAATRSTVVVAVLRTTENVGRDQCEELAAKKNLLASGPRSVIEDEVTMTQTNFDTVSGPGSPLVGHVTAVGGFLHKCFVFDFSTRVDRASDEDALSARLAFARTRILGGLELDSFAQVPAQAPSAGMAPP
jgi:hypothetical protein